MNGIVVISKEAGYTSFDVCAILRRLLNTKKVGHTGTLDPDAEGVIVVCVGNATGAVSILTAHEKEYICTMRLGIDTDTYDVSGVVTAEGRYDFSDREIEDVLNGFVGEQLQVPPKYSAIKVNGKRLYSYARNNEEVELPKREIKINDIRILDINIPTIKFKISCEKGTYIRSICHDAGIRLGSYACMERLFRTRVGAFGINDAITLSELEKMVVSGDYSFLRSVDSCFDYPKLIIEKENDILLYNGNKLPIANCDNGRYLTYDSKGAFKGIYEKFDSSDVLKPVKLFL